MAFLCSNETFVASTGYDSLSEAQPFSCPYAGSPYCACVGSRDAVVCRGLRLRPVCPAFAFIGLGRSSSIGGSSRLLVTHAGARVVLVLSELFGAIIFARGSSRGTRKGRVGRSSRADGVIERDVGRCMVLEAREGRMKGIQRHKRVVYRNMITINDPEEMSTQYCRASKMA